MYLARPELKKFLSEIIGDEWKSHISDLSDMQKYFVPNTYDEISVMNGFSIAQYKESQKGGIHVNPALTGIILDGKRWNKIFRDAQEQAHQIQFINVPYDFYKKIAQENAIDKHSYDAQNMTLQEVLETYPGYVHRLH